MQTRDQYDNDSVRRIFEAIARDTMMNDGGTFQHKTGARVDLARQYGSGYVVSVAEYGTCVAVTATLATLGERIAALWPKHIASNVQYIGTWPHRGVVFVDGVVVLPESARDIALALARKHGQTAIYNIRTASSELVADADEDAHECFADKGLYRDESLLHQLGYDIDPNALDGDADAHECFADDIATLRAIVVDALTSTDSIDFDRELRERLVSFIDATAEVRALVAELHNAIFGEESTASIVNESGDIVADTWIVERLRVLTDSEYAECAYGADDDDDARVGCGQYLYADNGAVAVCTQPRGVEHDHDQSVEEAVANGHAVWATTN